MSEQNIKVGDRVRATCGESVVIGTVASQQGEVVEVLVDGDASRFFRSHWSIEVIAPLIPDVVGTIVRDADGDAWQRASSGWLIISEDGDHSLNHVQKHYGPLTVLWTPEP